MRVHNDIVKLKNEVSSMLSKRVPWTIKDVVMVYILRIVVGLLLVRAVYPVLFGESSSFAVEMTDRLVVIGLVWFAVRSKHGNLQELGLSTDKLGRNVMAGLLAGIFLLGVSMYSERLYATTLFATPVQHPLVAQVQQALNWQQLMVPLFLAGLAAPVTEELLYRMFTFLPLKDRFGLWGGAVFSAAIFALLHFNAYWLVEIIVVGVGLALLYFWTGSLLSSIIAHSFINSTKVILLFLGIPLV